MWGHYANGHRGLAIEFETNALKDAVLADHEEQKGVPSQETDVWTEIKYSNTPEPITSEQIYQFVSNSKRFLVQHLERTMATKRHVWRAENEWRLMLRNTETDQNIVKHLIGSEAVSRIFLGLQFPDEEKNKIVAVARENFPASSIFHARKKHGDFAVEFHQY